MGLVQCLCFYVGGVIRVRPLVQLGRALGGSTWLSVEKRDCFKVQGLQVEVSSRTFLLAWRRRASTLAVMKVRPPRARSGCSSRTLLSPSCSATNSRKWPSCTVWPGMSRGPLCGLMAGCAAADQLSWPGAAAARSCSLVWTVETPGVLGGCTRGVCGCEDALAGHADEADGASWSRRKEPTGSLHECPRPNARRTRS